MDVRKNLLDLQYQKYVQYKVTTIIIIFTFFIGLFIAYITKQVKFDNVFDQMFIAILVIAVGGTGLNYIIEFDNHLENIQSILKKFKTNNIS